MPNVEYELSLRDGLTGKLNEAHGAANRLEGSMRTLGSRVLHVAEAFGISFALFKGIEFVHEGVEAFEKLHQAEAQVQAGLKSTNEMAGLTYEVLEEGAKKFAASFKFTRAEVTEMQSVMLTFPGITEKTFSSASQSIMDMSTRLHKGLDETAIMVGKALQDPERGITAMRRVGVNFNDTQTEIIKNLVKTGHAAKAQTLILQELQLEFAGSAQAAADADPLFRFNKLMGSLKMAVGEAAISLLHNLTPALEWVGQTLKGVGEWIKHHTGLLKVLAVGVGAAGAAYMVYRGILFGGVAIQAAQTAWTYIQIAAMYSLGTAYEGAGIASKLFAAAQWAVNAALTANPIGAVIVAVAAFAAAVYAAYQYVGWFRAGLWATWAVIKEFGLIVSDVFKGLYHTIHGAFYLNPAEIASGMMQTVEAVRDAATRIGKAAKDGYAAGIADFTKGSATATAPGDLGKNKKAMAVPVGETKPETKGAKGNKVVTINIKIDSLIKDFQIKTTNIKEGTAKMQEMVTQVMMNAVNNAQIVGGQ